MNTQLIEETLGAFKQTLIDCIVEGKCVNDISVTIAQANIIKTILEELTPYLMIKTAAEWYTLNQDSPDAALEHIMLALNNFNARLEGKKAFLRVAYSNPENPTEENTDD